MGSAERKRAQKVASPGGGVQCGSLDAIPVRKRRAKASPDRKKACIDRGTAVGGTEVEAQEARATIAARAEERHPGYGGCLVL
jgi:hypothetical protein